MKKWTLLVLVTAALALVPMVPMAPTGDLLASSTLYACQGSPNGCDGGCAAGERCASVAQPRNPGTCCVEAGEPTCIPESECDYELFECYGFCDPIFP